MTKWQNQGVFRRFMRSRAGLILLALLALWLARSVWLTWQKNRVVAADRGRVERELGETRAREERLANEIRLLKTESGLEQKIREKFAVVKEGEKVIAVLATDGATTTATTSKSWWQSLWSTGEN